jgi:hypothetical protein
MRIDPEAARLLHGLLDQMIESFNEKNPHIGTLDLRLQSVDSDDEAEETCTTLGTMVPASPHGLRVDEFVPAELVIVKDRNES